MTRRADAPMIHARRHGGAKDKAHTGCVPEKNTCMGRGGRCCTTFVPVAQMDRALVSYPGGLPVRIWPGALIFKWTPERANARKPATKARLRGLDCTDKGNLSIPLRTGFRKGACCEYVEPTKENSSNNRPH